MNFKKCIYYAFAFFATLFSINSNEAQSISNNNITDSLNVTTQYMCDTSKYNLVTDSLIKSTTSVVAKEATNKLRSELSKTNQFPVMKDSLLIDSYHQNAKSLLNTSSSPIQHFNLSFGASVTHSIFPDTSYLVPDFQKVYWLNTCATVYGLPINFNLATGDGIGFSGYEEENPIQFGFNFDYDAYIANLQTDLVTQFEEMGIKAVSDFKSVNLSDSVTIFNNLKDSLADADYLLKVSNLKDQKQGILDSIDNCYPVDSNYLMSINTELAHYDSVRARFTELLKFQNDYETIKRTYNEYMGKLNSFRDQLSNSSEFNQIQSIADSQGLKTNVPQWPSRFKEFSVGPQVVNLTPLTIQNYLSNGFITTYLSNRLLVTSGILSQNWYSRTNVTAITDSIQSIFQNNQTAKYLGVGLQKSDSSYFLFSVSNIHDNLNVAESKSILQSTDFSFYQVTKPTKAILLEYELATSKSSIKPEGTIIDTGYIAGNSNTILASGAAYAKMGYIIPKINYTVSTNYSRTGLSYESLGNSIVRPGTYNTGIEVSGKLLKNSVTFSYGLTISNTTEGNPLSFKAYYHTAQLDWNLKQIGSFHLVVIPYRYNYSVAEQTSLGTMTMVTGIAVLNLPIGKKYSQTTLSYSNYSSQNTALDSVYFLQLQSVSVNSVVPVSFTNFIISGSYFLRNSDILYEYVNSTSVLAEILNRPSMYISIGPKLNDFISYNDQIGCSLQLTSHLFRYANLMFTGDKFINIQQDGENYKSTFFFNSSISFTLK